MSYRTEVTRVEMDTLHEVSVTITVARVPVYQRNRAENVSTADVPQDIREALLKWLGGAA